MLVNAREMTGETFAYGLLAALAIALLAVIVTDIRDRKIYNKLVLPIALGAPLWWIATGEQLWPDVTVHLIAAVLVFLLFSIFFYLRVMGGGDVKLFTALALWFDWVMTTRHAALRHAAGRRGDRHFLVRTPAARGGVARRKYPMEWPSLQPG